MSLQYLQNNWGLSNGLQTMNAAGGGSVGGWVELGRTTLGSAGDTITVSSLADKRYYMILCDGLGTGAIRGSMRSGNGSVDTGSNYAFRRSHNGAAESTFASTSQFAATSGATADNEFWVQYGSNLSANEKLFISQTVRQNTAGAGNAPNRTEHTGKWVNTSNPLDSITLYNDQAGSYNTNAEVVVLGWDPADTHTTNFWEELASVDVSTGTTIDTGTFTAKKYLWIQTYLDDTTSVNYGCRFNSDSGTNYSRRKSNNGGSDSTSTSDTTIIPNHGFGLFPHYDNYFIINNSANEKLGIRHEVAQNTAGAGNAPSRQEAVFKWANTSSQITSFQLINSDSVDRCIIKVWGSD